MPARLLVVDDEPLIALDLEGMLEDAGFDVVAIARDMDTARRKVNDLGVDLVVLDADLSGTSSRPFAEDLRLSGVPFVVASGYSAKQLEWLENTPHITKPIDQGKLVAAIRAQLSAKE